MIVLQAKQIAESGFHFVWFDVLNSQRGLNTYIDLNSLANNLATIYMLAFVCKVELLKATTPYRKFFEATGSTAMKVRLFSDADPSNFRPDSRSGKNIPCCIQLNIFYTDPSLVPWPSYTYHASNIQLLCR